MRRLLSIAALMTICAFALSGAPDARADTEPIYPTGPAVSVPIGKIELAKSYYVVPGDGVVFRLEGPGKLSGFAKAHFDAGQTGVKAASIALSGVSGLPAELAFELKPSSRGVYADGRAGAPGRGARIALEIPAGRHELKLSGGVADGSNLYVLLYYEGPPQWGTEIVVPEMPEPKGPWNEKFGFTWRSSANMKFTYDDNAYKLSEDYKYEYRQRLYWNEEKFREVERIDDLVIAPNLSLEGRAKKLVPFGASRLGFRWSANTYLHNGALFNHEMRVYWRQNIGPGSLELYYNYSPSKYLRQLNDRPPLVSDNTPVVSEEFRLERNKIVSVWRQKLHKRVSSSFTLTKKLYYYNRPHVENDIDALSIDSSFGIKLSKKFDLKLQYEFENAKALGIDVVGQTLDTSPASDGSYKGNKYNAELSWKWPYKKISSKITLRAQYSVAYFSAYGDLDAYNQEFSDAWIEGGGPADTGSTDGEGAIAVDTYHTGRVDNVYTYQIKGGRKLPKKLQELMGWERSISMNYGFGYAERDVDSPWWGDIKEDKNWISRTYWVGFSTRLF